MFLPLAVSLASLVLAVSINILLAFLVGKNHPKTDLAKVFWILCVSASLWLIMVFLSTSIADAVNVLWAARLSLFFSVPQTVVLFLLADVLPSYKFSLSRNKLILLFAITVIAMVFTLTPYVFKSAEVTNTSISSVSGWGNIVFGLFHNLFYVGIFYLLIKKIKK